MKKGAKITVFIASMALTIASLNVFLGHRYCNRAIYKHGSCVSNNYGNDCGEASVKTNGDSTAK